MKEQWKPVKEFEGVYEVSNLGKIRRIKLGAGTSRTIAVLNPWVNEAGYLRVRLKNVNITKNLYVHRVVAVAFVHNPNRLPQVNHKGPKEDCRASMLEWRSTAGHGKDTAIRDQRGDGVHYEPERNKWKARYSPHGKSNVFIGRFNTYEEAKAARDAAVAKLEVTE